MKIVFLDIDGVVNSEDFMLREPPDHTISMRDDEWWAVMLDPKGIELFNGLLERTGAKVVISSSWRHMNEPEDMQRILATRGFTGEVIGAIPKRGGVCRGDRIKLWLDSTHHEVESFTILDDDDDMGGFDARFVLIDAEVGLRLIDCEAAEQLLAVPV